MRQFNNRICIIPARGGSKRIPRKNLARIGGKPLLQYAIDVALAAKLFDSVYVSSEDDEILHAAQSFGAVALQRPKELATDSAQVREVLTAVISSVSSEAGTPDAFCLLLPGHPLRTAEDVRGAYRIFLEQKVDVVLSTVPFTHPPQRSFRLKDDLLTTFLSPDVFLPTQELEQLYRYDGAVAWATTSFFKQVGSLVGGRTAPYPIPIERSVDIDTPLDLLWAEFLLSRKG